MVDFTNCKVESKGYGGSNGKKICINYNGELYLLKFPTHGDIKNPNLKTSYSNSCYSEHIGSTIFNILGMSAQKTILGNYTRNEKTYIVTACKDFETKGWKFQDFASMKNGVLDSSSSNGTGTEINEVLDAIQKQSFFEPAFLESFFWKMCVVDAYLGNFDRHNGNWGFLRNENSGEIIIAPIFDCGSCLYPQAVGNWMTRIMNDENELQIRINTRPTSAFRYPDTMQKIPYQELFDIKNNKICRDSVISMCNTIAEKRTEIKNFISSSDIPSMEKVFYTFMLEKRYERLLLPLFNKSLSIEKENKKAIEGFIGFPVFDENNTFKSRNIYIEKDSETTNKTKTKSLLDD